MLEFEFLPDVLGLLFDYEFEPVLLLRDLRLLDVDRYFCVRISEATGEHSNVENQVLEKDFIGFDNTRERVYFDSQVGLVLF